MTFNIEELVTHCEGRWGSGEYLSTLGSDINEWLSKATMEEQEILIRLLENFDFYPNRKASQSLQIIHKQISERLQEIVGQDECIYDNVLFFPVTKKNGTKTSSHHMYDLYVLVNRITKYCCKMDINSVVNDSKKPFNNIDHLVFIDDMIGSGDTMKKFLKQTFEDYPFLKEKKLYLIVLEACPGGINAIKKFAKPTEIDFFYFKLHEKAFLEGFIFRADELKRAMNVIENLEIRISDDGGKHVFGYKKSEALMAFYHNTPNNTLSSFWKSNSLVGWKPLFAPRDHYIPKYMRNSDTESVKSLEIDKQSRGYTNYNLKYRKANNNGI